MNDAYHSTTPVSLWIFYLENPAKILSVSEFMRKTMSRTREGLTLFYKMEFKCASYTNDLFFRMNFSVAIFLDSRR